MAKRQIFQLLEMSIMELHIKIYVPHRMHFSIYDALTLLLELLVGLFRGPKDLF